MCSCSSCEHTDSFFDKGFAAWPRGESAGRKAASAYAAHVAHANSGGVDRAIPAFRVGGPAAFPRLPGLVMPIAQNARAVRWNSAQKSKGRIAPADARPSQGSSPAAHFPERDRPLETAVIYAMPKPKLKQPVGRPKIGEKHLVVLDQESENRARVLGDGNLSAGIRAALKACRVPRRASS